MELGEWRQNILSQLQCRNKRETHCFQDLIAQHNRAFEHANSLRHENLQLSIQNEKLRIDGRGGSTKSNITETRLLEEVQQLNQKLLIQAEELAELHRRKGENAQQVIDLNIKLQEIDKVLASKESSLSQCHLKMKSLEAEIGLLTKNNKELTYVNDTLRDEYRTNMLAYNALEEKLRKVQDENRQLVERLIKYKAKDAEKMNEENDNFVRKRYAKMQKDLEEACRDPKGLCGEELQEGYGPISQSALPSKAHAKFDAHEGEVNAVKWSPLDRLVATGGADRKVKLWDISKGTQENKGILVGSNAGVMSVDFDTSGTLVLGASNDYATRVWTVADQRLRIKAVEHVVKFNTVRIDCNKHTLTGHSGKVMAARFLGEASKVVTGSHDRTLKIWDLRSRACIETKFAGSSCNDLVNVDNAGSTIISGHFDKSIRFWDSRSETSANNIVLNGKVTSLDLARDTKYLLACVRDDTLKLIDLRMNQEVKSFSCDGFKVGCDWSRATFSPDGQYVAVGSADGSVYIWGVNTGKVETILKEHGTHLNNPTYTPCKLPLLISKVPKKYFKKCRKYHLCKNIGPLTCGVCRDRSRDFCLLSAVTATAWHPYGSFLASVDRSKRAVIWAGDL